VSAGLKAVVKLVVFTCLNAGVVVFIVLVAPKYAIDVSSKTLVTLMALVKIVVIGTPCCWIVLDWVDYILAKLPDEKRASLPLRLLREHTPSKMERLQLGLLAVSFLLVYYLFVSAYCVARYWSYECSDQLLGTLINLLCGAAGAQIGLYLRKAEEEYRYRYRLIK
jgi:hypothetical protein